MPKLGRGATKFFVTELCALGCVFTGDRMDADPPRPGVQEVKLTSLPCTTRQQIKTTHESDGSGGPALPCPLLAFLVNSITRDLLCEHICNTR